MTCDKIKNRDNNCSTCKFHWTEECPNYHKYFCSKCGNEISEEDDIFNLGLCNNCNDIHIDNSYSNDVMTEFFEEK